MPVASSTTKDLPLQSLSSVEVCVKSKNPAPNLQNQNTALSWSDICLELDSGVPRAQKMNRLAGAAVEHRMHIIICDQKELYVLDMNQSV